MRQVTSETITSETTTGREGRTWTATATLEDGEWSWNQDCHVITYGTGGEVLSERWDDNGDAEDWVGDAPTPETLTAALRGAVAAVRSEKGLVMDTITVTIDRAAGTITVTDPEGPEQGTIRIFPDGAGWTRTNLQGEPLALYYPDRDKLIDTTAAGLSEATGRTVTIVGADR